MERQYRIRTHMVRLYCDKCGSEMALWSTGGGIHFYDPDTYLHKCHKCGHKETTAKRYPHETRVEEGREEA